ncbi:MAG: ATP-binding protein [Cellulophaga sp.]
MSFNLKSIFVYLFICITYAGMAQAVGIDAKEKEKVDRIFIFFNNGAPQKAYELAKKNLKILKTNKSKANLNLLLAQYFHNQSSIDSSLYFTKQALDYKINNDSLQARLTILGYNLYALNNKIKGLNQESKKWHLLGVELSEKANETNLKYWHLHGLANSYLSLDEQNKALVIFKECLKNSSDDEIILGSCINLGAIYSSLGQYDLSNNYLLRAKSMCQNNGRNNALASILLNIGNNFFDRGLLNDALETFYEVQKKSQENKLYNLELFALGKIGTILFKQKRYNDASLIFSQNLSKSIDLGILSSEMHSYEMLSKIFEKKGDYKSAYTNRKNYIFIKDSIANLEKGEEINRLEIKYQTLEKEKAIKILQIESNNKTLKIKNRDAAIETYKLEQSIIAKQNENQVLQFQNGAEKRKNEIALLKEREELKAVELSRQKTIQYVVLIAFFILLIPIIGLLVIYYQKLQAQSLLLLKEKEINVQKVNSLLKDQEIKLIKASIAGQDQERKKIAQEMHDSIGGNLAAIKLQFSQLSDSPDKIDLIYRQLDDTYEQVRSLSHNLLPKKVRETDFIRLINEYIKNIADACKIEVNTAFYSEEKLNNLAKELQNDLYAIFQELTTNTIKHAKATSIDLQLDLLNDSIFFVFEDNGVGFNIAETASGIGLTNVKSRVANIGGVLHIDSHPNRGTIINIEIPITSK